MTFYIPQSVMANGDENDILEAVQNFISRMLMGGHNPQDIDAHALQALSVVMFTQVAEDYGHAAYFWDYDNPSRRDIVRQGLTAIGAQDVLALFDKGAALADAAERDESDDEDAGFDPKTEEQFDVLDGMMDELFESQEMSFEKRVADFVRQAPGLVAVADEQYKEKLEEIAGPVNEEFLNEALQENGSNMFEAMGSILCDMMCARHSLELQDILDIRIGDAEKEITGQPEEDDLRILTYVLSTNAGDHKVRVDFETDIIQLRHADTNNVLGEISKDDLLKDAA